MFEVLDRCGDRGDPGGVSVGETSCDDGPPGPGGGEEAFVVLGRIDAVDPLVECFVLLAERTLLPSFSNVQVRTWLPTDTARQLARRCACDETRSSDKTYS